jgi:hypothetical protein
MADDYDRVKHLEMIGKVIERMDRASFSLKALSPSALAVALVLIEKARVPSWLALGAAAISVMIYWFLDASYLAREKAFRSLFNMVRNKEVDDRPYIMELRQIFGTHKPWRCMVASVVALVHIPVLMTIGVCLYALSLHPGI